MKKWHLLFLLIIPAFAFATPNVEYYIGEVMSQILEEENPQHFGFVFLKRTFFHEENSFLDNCLISTKDGETLELHQLSELTNDLHEVTLGDESGLISGSGELVGFPWHWTHLQEKLELNIESPIEVEVNNTFEDETMFSIASVFTLEEDGSREYFGTFTAKLYRVDVNVIENFFHSSE